jgi:antitoxin CptB
MDIETKRKKLLYQSWYRGCKETDKIIGGWAKENIENLDEGELEELSLVLKENDNDIYDWISGKYEIPEDMKKNSVFMELTKFKPSLKQS